MINPKTVYAKTAKGQEEIDKRTHKLPLKLRSLLIMVNGKVSAGEIIEYGGAFGGGMDVLLGQLVEGAFIEPARSAPAPVSAQPAPAPPDNEKAALQAAKSAIRKLVYDQLGPDADMVVGKLDKCESRLQLVAYCDTCKDIVEAALGKSKGQVLWAKAKESIETAFAGAAGMASTAAPSLSVAPVTAASPAPAPATTTSAPPLAKPAPAVLPSTQPKREVDRWIFEKVRGEISRLVFDALGPDGEMMAMKIEKAGSMNELKGLTEKIHEVVRGVCGKQKADDARTRIEGLIAAVEGGK